MARSSRPQNNGVGDSLLWFRCGGPREPRASLLVVSELCWWPSHYEHGRSARCAGVEMCQRCADGSPMIWRFVVAVRVDGESKPRLFEIPYRQVGLLDELDNDVDHGIGARLSVYRDGKSARSPVGILMEGWDRNVDQANRLDIRALVATLGLPARLVATPDASDVVTAVVATREQPELIERGDLAERMAAVEARMMAARSKVM